MFQDLSMPTAIYKHLLNQVTLRWGNTQGTSWNSAAPKMAVSGAPDTPMAFLWRDRVEDFHGLSQQLPTNSWGTLEQLNTMPPLKWNPSNYVTNDSRGRWCRNCRTTSDLLGNKIIDDHRCRKQIQYTPIYIQLEEHESGKWNFPQFKYKNNLIMPYVWRVSPQ